MGGLSKEEKKARKEAKKLAKKQAAEALRRKLKHDHLEREIAAHNLWRTQINRTWQDAMLRIKKPVYRQQIEVMWHTLDRAYDKRDDLRDHIMNLRTIAEKQYHRTIAHFCKVSGDIINTFLTDLENLVKQNDDKTADVLKQNRVEIAYLLEYKRRAETHMQLLLYTSHEAADTIAWNTKGENMVRRDEDASTYLEILENLKYVLEGKQVAIWQEYKNTIKNYIISTADNQKQLRVLRKKEQMMTDIIAAQAKKIIMSEKLIRRLRIDLLAYETGEKQAGFRDRRNRHREACDRLKKCMQYGLEIDAKQINALVKVSDEATDWIKAAGNKCEKILRMASLCRKLETRPEKVIPYGFDIPHESIKVNVRSHSSDDPMVADALSVTYGATRLWHRISKVELTKRALLQEKVKLERENTRLLRVLAKQNNENILPVSIKGQGTFNETKGKTSNKTFQPHAVDGNMEIRKFIHY